MGNSVTGNHTQHGFTYNDCFSQAYSSLIGRTSCPSEGVFTCIGEGRGIRQNNNALVTCTGRLPGELRVLRRVYSLGSERGGVSDKIIMH